MSLKFFSFAVFLLFFQTTYGEAIKYYSDGSLKNGVHYSEEGVRFTKLFENRKKSYSTKELLTLLNNLSEFISTAFPDAEMMQVGDMSGEFGGKARRHSSHQNGLDVDIVYLRKNRTGQNPSETEWGEYFVINNKVTKNFDAKRNWDVFQYLVKNYPVGRIFVDLKIKQRLCQKYEKGATKLQRETLRRLRPVNLHKTHFHIRLKCPASDLKCRSQSEPPKGTGCQKRGSTPSEGPSC